MKLGSERARERTVGGRERIRVSERKSLGREARSGGSHPLASPPLRDSGLVTTSGWYVEPKPYVSSLGSHPSRLSLPASPLFPSSIFLALSPLHHRSTTRTPWFSSLRPLFTFFPSRPARLSRILFPWFTRPSRERGEFARLSTVLFPILYLFPFLSLLSHLCLFISSVHRFLSSSIAANAEKDGNVDKAVCRCRHLDVIYRRFRRKIEDL